MASGDAAEEETAEETKEEKRKLQPLRMASAEGTPSKRHRRLSALAGPPRPELCVAGLQVQCKAIERALESSTGGLGPALAAAAAETPLQLQADKAYKEPEEYMLEKNAEVIKLAKEGTGDVAHLASQLHFSKTKTINIKPDLAFQRDALVALTSCVGNLQLSEKGQLHLRSGNRNGTYLKGGWALPYPAVNVTNYDHGKQKGCVLTLKVCMPAHVLVAAGGTHTPPSPMRGC